MKKVLLIIATILIVIAIVSVSVFFIVKGLSNKEREYEIETVSEYNYFVLREDNKFGVLDKNAKTIIEAKYNQVIIPNPEKAVFLCIDENSKVKVLNENNEEILTQFEAVEAIRLKNIVSDLMYEKSVLKYKENNKYGLIDYSGNKVTEAIYDRIQALEYKEGELLVEKDGNVGIISIKGKELVPIKYLNVNSDGYYTDQDKFKYSGYIVSTKTEMGYRYGFIDREGNEVLKPEYNDLSRVTDLKDNNNAYFIASKNGQFGVYKNSDQLLKNEYQSISYNKNNNIFLLEKSKTYGAADINGNRIIDIKYTQIDSNGNTLYAKTKDGNVDVYDAKGNKSSIPSNVYKYSAGDNYSIKITNDNGNSTYSVEDNFGNEIIKPEYIYIKYLYDDLFIVSKEQNKLGIIDTKGNQKVELKYSSIQTIKDTKMIQALIKDENKVDIYSSKMEKLYEMIKPQFTEINGFIRVTNETDTIFLSQEEKVVDSKVVYSNNKLFANKQNEKWGFIDDNGTVKVQAKYDKVTDFNKYGYAGIKLNGKWGVIDQEGNIVVEPTYELNNEPEFLGKYYKVVYGLGEFYYTNK